MKHPIHISSLLNSTRLLQKNKKQNKPMPVLLKLVHKLERQDTIPVSLSKARVTLMSKPNEDTAKKTIIGQTLYEKMADRLMQFWVESRKLCPLHTCL